MEFSEIVQELEAKQQGGRKYEQEGHGKFRDMLSIGRDGSFLFERFCYGEAAGLVFSLRADRVDSDGKIAWKMEESNYSGKEEAPRELTDIKEDGALQLDGGRLLWKPVEELKRLPGAKKGLLGFFAKKRK